MFQALQTLPTDPPAASLPVPNPLPRLLTGEDLTSDDSEHLFERGCRQLEPAISPSC